jgi:hypothetical protein
VLESTPRLAETAMAASLRTAVLAAALLTVPAVASHAGDLYQWKDAKGVTHYSDAPPAKGQYRARSIDVRAGQPAPAATEQVKPTTTASANCSLARTNLERLKAGGNIGLDANGDGKPDAPLSAEESLRQTQLAQASIKSYCTPQADAPAP